MLNLPTVKGSYVYSIALPQLRCIGKLRLPKELTHVQYTLLGIERSRPRWTLAKRQWSQNALRMLSSVSYLRLEAPYD